VLPDGGRLSDGTATLMSKSFGRRKENAPMLPSVPNGPTHQLRLSRRDFLVFSLCFVATSCASAPVKYQGTYTGHHGAATWGVTWSPDGKRIASSDSGAEVNVWDPLTGRTLLTYTGHSRRVQAAAWSPDGRRLAAAS
jgi:WD40 repeat protein